MQAPARAHIPYRSRVPTQTVLHGDADPASPPRPTRHTAHERRHDDGLRRTIRTRSTDSILSPMRGVRSETRFRQDSCRACPNHDPSSPLRLILPSRIHHRTPTASTRTACRANPGTHARAVSCPRQARDLHAAPNQKPGNQARAVSCSISRSQIHRHPETRSYSFHAPGFGSSLWRSADSAHLISSNFQPDSSLSSIFLRVFG